MVSFLVRKASTLAWQPLLRGDELLLLGLELLRLRLQVGLLAATPHLRVRASRARSSRPATAPGGPGPLLVRLLLQRLSCSSSRLREVATSATPRRTFCSSSSCFS